MNESFPEEDLEGFASLIERSRGGCDEACRELVERYNPHVLRAVRRKLSKRMRARFDSSDFSQQAWASFFIDLKEIEEIAHPGALVKLLSLLARNKVIEEFRRVYRTQKKNLNREHSLDGSAAFAMEELHARVATPSQLAAVDELWGQLLDKQPATHQQIVRLRKAGLTQEQIAGLLQVHVRTVQRVMRRMMPESKS